MYSGSGGLEWCASYDEWFPEQRWCSGDSVIRITDVSYEHCSGDCPSMTNNTCPLSTPDCSVGLKNDTRRSLVERCDGNTWCSVQAGRSWSGHCVTRWRTDYMKIVYDCRVFSTSLAAAAAAAAVTSEMTTAYRSDDDERTAPITTSQTQSRLLAILLITTGTVQPVLQYLYSSTCTCTGRRSPQCNSLNQWRRVD